LCYHVPLKQQDDESIGAGQKGKNYCLFHKMASR
jgi:hypothetical protein